MSLLGQVVDRGRRPSAWACAVTSCVVLASCVDPDTPVPAPVRADASGWQDVDASVDTAVPADGVDLADGASPACNPLACLDDNPCTIDGCNDQGCWHTLSADGSACGIGSCSGTTWLAAATCQKGVCTPGTTTKSCDDLNPCTQDQCTASGCVHSANDGVTCTSGGCAGLSWQGLGVCQLGQCSVPPVQSCDDQNPCTLDGCAAQSGCTHLASSAPCDDGDPCTVGDICMAKVCAAGVAMACDDNNPCTSDACIAGQCSHLPQDLGCSDGNACTQQDLCLGGVCTGAAVDCDDAIACSIDSCDPKKGCVHVTSDKLCDDGNACTTDSCVIPGGCTFDIQSSKTCNPAQCSGDKAIGAGTCNQGICVYPSPVACVDDNACTTDSCVGGACVYTNNTVPCEDGNPCTLGDACLGGSCKAEGKADCNDNNPCTTDSCLDSSCVHVATGEAMACDDGQACTLGDVCTKGVCAGKAAGISETLLGGQADAHWAAALPAGNGWVAGGETANTAGGDNDGWLVKLDAKGQPLWQQHYGNADEQRGFALAPLGSGWLLAGYNVSQGALNADAWAVGTDANGNALWQKSYGGAQFDAIYGAASTADGGAALAGFTFSYGAGLSDAWLLRIDSKGKLLWTRTYGGKGEDGAYAVATLTDGFVICGESSPVGPHQAWLARSDASGNLLWQLPFGSGGNADLAAVLATADGFVAVGSANGAAGKQGLLLRADAKGQLLGAQVYGGGGSELFAVTQTPNGLAAAGSSDSGSSGWLVRTDALGQLSSQYVAAPAAPAVVRSVNVVGTDLVLIGSRGNTGPVAAGWWLHLPGVCP